ncbi:hypothetical protein OIV83_004059 [Microbotryomycetes sp. JL201]|nr:hypothetical protein OIV83_004059 [Microbotryomycetes sp. JL201]
MAATLIPPNSRLENGVDVKFSIDDLKDIKVSSWDGVRNHQAKNFMKQQMKVGDSGLFYHSSCKVPAVVGLCKVVKEGYPDHSAWNSKSPYFDPKSKKDDPTWYMVDVEHPVSLSTLQRLSSIPHSSLPDAVKAYLTSDHQKAVASSQLLSKGRLSVQPCSDEFYEAVVLLGENGGWEDGSSNKNPGRATKKAKALTKSDEDDDDDDKKIRARRPKRQKLEKVVVTDEGAGEAKEKGRARPKTKR